MLCTLARPTAGRARGSAGDHDGRAPRRGSRRARAGAQPARRPAGGEDFWQRELIRFARNRIRIATSLLQPLLFLFVLGTGLSRLAQAGTHGVNLRTFVYPGCWPWR
jgi:hypothetical protein